MSEPTNITNTINETVSQFSSPTQVDTTDSTFLNSNGIIAKVVFLIMVILIFIFLFYLIINLISFFSQPSQDPLLINGQIAASTDFKQIPQNPANPNSIRIKRSNNKSNGIEFTWSVWLNYTPPEGNTPYSNGQITYQPVFIKGDCSQTNGSNTSGYSSINHGPGVYFYNSNDDPDTNNTTIHLQILMDSIDSPGIDDPIIIPNLPGNIYFLLNIRCQGSNIDVYINGTIIYRKTLKNVPKQNYYDVNVCPNNGVVHGFPGYLSNLQYYSRALSIVEINSIYKKGPNTKPIMNGGLNSKTFVNFSSNWFNNFIN